MRINYFHYYRYIVVVVVVVKSNRTPLYIYAVIHISSKWWDCRHQKNPPQFHGEVGANRWLWGDRWSAGE